MKIYGPRLLLFCALVLSSAVSLVATTVIAPAFDELVGGADYVVRATVVSVTSEWREKGGYRKIYTQVELAVSEVITGTPPERLVLQILGGVVGDQEFRVVGTPKFKVGEESVLFVQANGRQYYPLVGIMHGKYLVKHDAMTGREYMARSNGVPLYETKEVVEPMEGTRAARTDQLPMSPAEFMTQIRATHQGHHQARRQH